MENIFNGEGSTGEPHAEVNYTCGIDLSNVDYVPTQEEPLPSQSRKKAGHKRTKIFTSTEDEIICSAYLNKLKGGTKAGRARMTSLSTPNAENVEVPGEGSKDDTLPSRISRPMGRDKAKKVRSSSASNSSACLEVLQKMQTDRQIYEQRVEDATSAAETAIACRAERKLAIQEENLRVQQVMQTDRQRLKDKISDGNFAIAVRAERKLAIQEEQLRV